MHDIHANNKNRPSLARLTANQSEDHKEASFQHLKLFKSQTSQWFGHIIIYIFILSVLVLCFVLKCFSFQNIIVAKIYLAKQTLLR